MVPPYTGKDGASMGTCTIKYERGVTDKGLWLQRLHMLLSSVCFQEKTHDSTIHQYSRCSSGIICLYNLKADPIEKVQISKKNPALHLSLVHWSRSRTGVHFKHAQCQNLMQEWQACQTGCRRSFPPRAAGDRIQTCRLMVYGAGSRTHLWAPDPVRVRQRAAQSGPCGS
jgi:hypothetical protein